MNYGANYAAIPDTENMILYALKGLIGSFKGRFEIFPITLKYKNTIIGKAEIFGNTNLISLKIS